MESGADHPEALNRPLALLEVAVAALLTSGAAALYLAMPNLIIEGGLPAAQEFITLSPVFFPRLTFGAMTFLGLSYLVRALRQIPPGPSRAPGGDPDRYGRVLVMLLFAILYPFLLPRLGYGAATLVVMGGVTLFLGNRLWWQLLLVAVCGPVTIRFVFERLLKISLPRGSIEPLAVGEEALMQFLTRVFFVG